MVYKNGPPFRIRSVGEIKEDLLWAAQQYADNIQSVFFPAGNTIIIKTADLVDIFSYTTKIFPHLKRITIYGSAQYIVRKTLQELHLIHQAGLTRIHLGLESGDNDVLHRVRKGSTAEMQTRAGQLIKQAGIELSEYVVLGLGGTSRSTQHITGTISVLNEIDPDFIRIRTLLPKINTPLLNDVKSGRFQLLTPHEILQETYDLINGLDVTSMVLSDHYTNYISVQGKLPHDKQNMLDDIQNHMKRDPGSFRDIYIGTQ